jgi:hypothetical protein
MFFLQLEAALLELAAGPPPATAALELAAGPPPATAEIKKVSHGL